MKFTMKDYKLTKIKNYFKKYNFFFLTSAIAPKNNIKTAQELKRLNLDYYKLYNTLTKRILTNSIYYNYQPLINGLIMITLPHKKEVMKPRTNELITFLSIKLNNKIYSINQINSITNFDYNCNCKTLTKTFKIALKPIKVFTVN